MRFAFRKLLAVIVMITASIFAYQVWQFESRKTFTQPVFEITNGTDGDRAMRTAAAESVQNLSVFGSTEPELVAFRISPGRGRYVISAYWIGSAKTADGFEIAFSDGRKIVTPFSKDKSGEGDRWLFYSAMVFSEKLPETFSSNTPGLVSSITLTKAGKKCSNSVTKKTKGIADAIWTDSIGKNIDDDFDFWGFKTQL